jgi:hypothetical protein
MKKTAPPLFSGALILLIIIIALVIYLFTRPSKSIKTDETEDLPTITEAGVDLVLNPADKPDNVEEYSIFTTEYAIGETTAKNIDILLAWKNGPNFAIVESLIFVHKNKSGIKVREVVTTTTKINSNTAYDLLFKGEDLTNEDIVGTNTIEIYYTTKDTTDITELNTVSFTITQEHLDTTLNLDNADTINIPVELSSTLTPSGEAIATYTEYRISPFFTDPVYIRKTTSGDKSFHIMKNNEKQTIDGVDTFYIIKALDKEFISKDASGQSILRGDTKKFVSKNDIFSDIDIVNSSSIQISIVEVCSFDSSSSAIRAWLDTKQNKNSIIKRCEDKAGACTSSDKFFTSSDFEYTPEDCDIKCSSYPSFLKSYCLNPCKTTNSIMKDSSENIKKILQDKKYNEMCKIT